MKQLENVTDDVEGIFSIVKECVNEVHNGNEVIHKIDMTKEELSEFIDSLIPIHYNDIWEVAQKLNLGHVSIRQNYIHPEMTVYTFLQGAITQVYYGKFTETLIEMGVPELQ